MPSTPEACDDFDFEFGAWTVEHRRLRERLCGCSDWEEFAGSSTTQPILGGNGNIEQNEIHLPSGLYRAVALRGYNPKERTWAIWWLDERKPNTLDPPVIGGFREGIGEFLAKDKLDGRPILVRFRWLDTDKPRPRWEQAFSSDEGLTWETNWTMRFTRVLEQS